MVEKWWVSFKRISLPFIITNSDTPIDLDPIKKPLCHCQLSVRKELNFKKSCAFEIGRGNLLGEGTPFRDGEKEKPYAKS